jgi:SAM-dependent methyltransferase
LDVAQVYIRFHRVASDCKPWPPGGQLARCKACGFVQTLITPQWQAEADQIYAGYTIYHQSGGAEQNVFQDSNGAGKPRSEQLIQALRTACPLPNQGRLLDIGCGNGSFLSAWSRLVPGWTLCGTEVGEKYKAQIESIPGVERLFTGDIAEVPGTFDVISLIHVLEHIPYPVAFLERLRKKLKPDGLLFIEVPDCQQNCFMLLVADHCSHFSPGLLAGVVKAAGFDVRHATNEWVAKEVSVVARSGADASGQKPVSLPQSDSLQVFNGWQELHRILAKVRPLAQRENFGLFGTAIAATWLDAQFNRAARFFVDEDLNRVGKTHLGRPIVSPAEIPDGATVFVALPQPLAGNVAERLLRLDKRLSVELP